jgi:iron complex transport system ATP-binding protein
MMIATRQLALRAGGRTLVRDLDWTVKAGECWSIVGRNGAGKSTLLRTVTGLRAPEAGSVELHGRPLADWPLEALARERAYLPQARSDAFAYSVMETVLSARHPYHANRYWEHSDDHHAALDALGAMEVDHLAARDVRTLSGGERQRVAIAALLAQDTPLLLLDEPANALDLAHQVSVMRLLAALCRERGKTVVMVGHDLNLAHRVASHALLLMGDGTWRAGSVADTLQPAILSDCLGHPINSFVHGERTIFLAAE